MLSMFKDRLDKVRRDVRDRRRSQRARVLLGGKIVYGAGFTADCRVRDITRLGARLVMNSDQQAPDDFHLIVVRDGVVYRAARQWIQDGEAGVSFHDRHDFDGPLPPQLQPMRELWAELALRP